jgi:hypothetical protein
MNEQSDSSRCSNVAEQIATDILTVWSTNPGGVECTRMQAMLMQPDGTEKNMGGRCKESIIKTIIPHLERLLDR